MLVLYLGKCSPSDFCLSHLERGHKVTLALNDLSKSIQFDFRALKSLSDRFKWVSEINILEIKYEHLISALDLIYSPPLD